jgi:hypothetical protein
MILNLENYRVTREATKDCAQDSAVSNVFIAPLSFRSISSAGAEAVDCVGIPVQLCVS